MFGPFVQPPFGGFQRCPAVVLLAGTGLTVQTLRGEWGGDLGIESDGLYTFGVSPTPAGYAGEEERVAWVTDVVERVSALPGVQVAGITNLNPLRSQNLRRNSLILLLNLFLIILSSLPQNRSRVQRLLLLGEGIPSTLIMRLSYSPRLFLSRQLPTISRIL